MHEMWFGNGAALREVWPESGQALLGVFELSEMQKYRTGGGVAVNEPTG
jgi:hypothetical protein